MFDSPNIIEKWGKKNYLHGKRMLLYNSYLAFDACNFVLGMSFIMHFVFLSFKLNELPFYHISI